MTKREMFTALIDLAQSAGRDDLVSGIAHELELLDHKTAPKHKAADANRDVLLDMMEPKRAYTATQLMNLMALSSTQKVSALLSPLVAAGTITRIKQGKSTYFTKM